MNPLVSPVACTVWLPGVADRGTLKREVNDPEGSVTAVATAWVSKEMSTVSDGPNPLPTILTLPVGGATEGLSLIWVVVAEAAGMPEAREHRARITSAVTQCLRMGSDTT